MGQTLKLNMGRLSASNNISVAKYWSGPNLGTAKEGDAKSWREKMVAKRKEKHFPSEATPGPRAEEGSRAAAV